MDTNRFERLVRALAASGTRRHVTGLGVAGLAAMVNVGGAAAKKKRRCKRRLSLRAKQCLRLSKDRCRAVPKPDGKACEGDGQCLAGTCNPQPTCHGAGYDTCVSNDECCSGDCLEFLCMPGVAGRECYEAGDCVSCECVGYRCT